MGKNKDGKGNGGAQQPPNAEKSILSQRSLIRGVIMRAQQISESFLDIVDPLSDENTRTDANEHIWEHRLKLRNHVLLGQTVGFWVETHDPSKPSLRMFFNGMGIVFFLCRDYQDGKGNPLCSVDVFRQAKRGDPNAIAGAMAEVDFWENDFEQTLSECIKFITPYTTNKGGVSTQNSVYSERDFIDGIDRFALSKDKDSTLSVSVDNDSKRISLSRASKTEGFSYAEISADKLSDVMQTWKQKDRILPDLENNHNRFVYSLMENVNKKRNEGNIRDEDGNLIQNRKRRVKLAHSYDPTVEDVSDLIKRQGTSIVTRTASEVVKGASHEHKNRQEQYAHEKRVEKSKQDLLKRKENIAAMTKVRDAAKRKLTERTDSSASESSDRESGNDNNASNGSTENSNE